VTAAALDLPDLPRWIYAHGVAAEPDHWQRPLGGGTALGHDPTGLLVLVGAPDPAATAALIAGHPQHTLVFAIEHEDVTAALRAAGRTVERAILHTLPDVRRLPDDTGAVPLPGDAVLAEPYPDDLPWARGRTTVWTVYVDGQPASFAYATWRSPRWFDISVETVPAARQLGLATRVAAALIRHEHAAGRAAVWGSDEDNLASLRLARRLGFEPADELWASYGSAP
jgi:GNAT superfamily N-acetyltransferase